MNRKALKFSFILYIAVLLWVILLRMNLAEFTGRYNGIVLIPFSDDQNYTSSLARDLCNVGNVALFFPVGFAGMLLCSDGKSKLLYSLGICLGISLGIEVLQYVSIIGMSSVSDLILNCAGGLCGIVFYYIFGRLLSDAAIEKICRLCTFLLLPICIFAAINTAINIHLYI